MTNKEKIEQFIQKFTELGVYSNNEETELGVYSNNEEQEPIEDFLEGMAFGDADGNGWDLIQWIRVALQTLIQEQERETIEEFVEWYNSECLIIADKATKFRSRAILLNRINAYLKQKGK